MKAILVLSLLVASTFSFAQSVSAAECKQQAAQINVKVKAVEKLDDFGGSCTVSIDLKTLITYNMDETCPLDIVDVLQEGVEVGIANGHDCRLEAGDQLSGVIVKKSWGTIYMADLVDQN